MSANLHAVLFEEAAAGPEDGGRFAGVLTRAPLADLPLWGNFTVSDVLRASNPELVRLTRAFPEDPQGLGPLAALLEDPEVGKSVLVGRTGNPVLADWPALAVQAKKTAKGLIKVQVGGVPSDLYFMERKRLREVVARFIRKKPAQPRGGGFFGHLFQEVLQEGFERIVKCGGLSFFMRDSYEYFVENLRIVSRLSDGLFVEMYRRLRAVSASNTVVGAGAVVKGSFLGNGAVVHGSVEGSVIFGGVTIGKGSLVRNSVILPSNRVGERVRIENALVLGGKERAIEHESEIGSGARVKNIECPDILKHGLTILGEGVNIPPRSRVGAGCLVLGRFEHGRVEQARAPLEVRDGSTFRP